MSTSRGESRMRVAYLTSEYPAPSHTFIRREVMALRERGVDVETFSIRSPGRDAVLSEAAERERARTTYVLPTTLFRVARSQARALLRPVAYVRTLRDALRHRVPGLRALLWASFHFVEAILLVEALRRAKITHLHNHFANSSATVGYLASRFLGIDFSLTLHGISEFDHPAGTLLPAKIAHARFVACVSYFGRAQAMRITPSEHWSKMRIVRCGVPLEAIPKRKDRKGPIRVLAVGRLSPEKGHLGLLEAFARAAAGIEAELRIVGGGPLRDEIARRIEQLGLGGRCTLTGQLPNDEVLALLADSDVFVLPSFMEGLPVVLMEAMAAEVPVIAPWVAGIPELVTDGENGRLYRVGDFDHLATRLRELLEDAGARLRMGRAGAERVRDEFDVRKAIEPLIERFGSRAGAEHLRPRLDESEVTGPLRVGLE